MKPEDFISGKEYRDYCNRRFEFLEWAISGELNFLKCRRLDDVPANIYYAYLLPWEFPEQSTTSQGIKKC